MKTFKIILILILLVNISFSVCSSYNRPLTQEAIKDWQESFQDASATTDMTTGTTYWRYVDEDKEPGTLLSWFKALTLEEKVEIYNWWKYESVNLKIVSEYGEIFIRLDKDD